MHTHSYISMCDFWYCLFWAMNGCLFWWMVLSIEAVFILKHRQVRLEHVWCNRGSCYIPVRVWDFLWVPISFMGWEIYTGQRHCVDCVDRFFFLLEANFSSRFSQGTHQLGWNWSTSPSPPGIFHQLIDYICPAVLIRCFRRCEESGLTHRWPSGVFQELVLVAGGMDIPFPRLLQRCLCMLPAVFCRCFCWCSNKKNVLVVYFARHVWITSKQSWICRWVMFVDEDFFRFGFLYTGAVSDPTSRVPDFPPRRDIQKQIPFAIIRPSGVVSAALEPLPGWVDAYLLVEPLIDPQHKLRKTKPGDEMALPCSLDKYCLINDNSLIKEHQ